jgi:hypothetical protein
LGLSVLGFPACQYIFVCLWYCFILGVSCYLSPNLKKDLRRELKKVLL